MQYIRELPEGHHLIGSHGGLMCALAYHLGLKYVVSNCSVVSTTLCPKEKELIALNFVWELDPPR
jgi:hypothetical protein